MKVSSPFLPCRARNPAASPSPLDCTTFLTAARAPCSAAASVSHCLQIERHVVHLRPFDPEAGLPQPKLDLRLAVEPDKSRIALRFDGPMRGALDRVLAADELVEGESSPDL